MATVRVPCDTPLYPVEELKNSQGGIFAHLDFSGLSPEYASKQGIFDTNNAGKRARLVRQWLKARDEEIIVGTCKYPYHCFFTIDRVADRFWFSCCTWRYPKVDR